MFMPTGRYSRQAAPGDCCRCRVVPDQPGTRLFLCWQSQRPSSSSLPHRLTLVVFAQAKARIDEYCERIEATLLDQFASAYTANDQDLMKVRHFCMKSSCTISMADG